MQIELKRLQKQLGITFIYITHDQEEALNMSDRIAVMREGRFEQIGTPAQVYDRPDTAYVAAFVGAANILQGKAVSVRDSLVTVGFEGASGWRRFEKRRLRRESRFAWPCAPSRSSCLRRRMRRILASARRFGKKALRAECCALP